MQGWGQKWLESGGLKVKRVDKVKEVKRVDKVKEVKRVDKVEKEQHPGFQRGPPP